MNLISNNFNLVNSLMGSNSSRRTLSFDSSMYTDIRAISRRNYRYLLKRLDEIENSDNTSSDTITTNNTKDSRTVVMVKSDAEELKKSADALMSKDKNSVFNQYKAETSDKDIIESAYMSGVSSFSKKTITVDVKQAAESQRNTSSVLNSKEKTLDTGSYAFEITMGGKTKNIYFSVDVTDNNSDVNKKIAEAVNKADFGVTAKVNTADGKTFLNFEADKTGEGENGISFEIKDKSYSNVVEKLGLDNVTREGKNAIYTINNGVEIESYSNEIDLGNNAKAVIKAGKTGEVTLNFDYDKDSIKSSVKEFINDYNQLLSTLQTNSTGTNKVSSLYGQLSAIGSANRNAFSRMGISVSNSGTLTLNEDKFDKADINNIKSMFSGSGSFADSVSKKASNIYNNINSYANSSSSTYGSQKTYINTFNIGNLYNEWF